MCVNVDGYEIANVYKPPPTRLQASDFPHPCSYADDLNCPHADWGYGANNAHGECLVSWASINSFALLYNAIDSANFHSGRLNSGTKPKLAFASADSDSRLRGRRVQETFFKSQHRPSLITPPRFALPGPRMPVKRWNFRKAKWSHCIALTNKFAKTLVPPYSPDVDQAYQDFCNATSSVIKRSIPRGRRNNHISCWDAECESLYQVFLRSPDGNNSSKAATNPLTRLDRKRRDRWSEAVHRINFSHFNQKAWSILE